jgi:alginate O-acetyltransferase complex protein AlgI
MVFSSTVFLLLFLPLVAILYYLCPRRGRNVVLLLASLLFYGWGEPKYILIMLFSTVFDYCNGLGIGYFRRHNREWGAKAVLILSVVGNLGILGFFKYTDFAIANINSLLSQGIPALGLALPIGISFYTFQTMSYTIDVYRGQVASQRNILDFAAYVTLFPQLIAGPIVQYKTVEHQLHARQENWLEASRGMQRFVIGLGKKVLIANQAGAIWETISAMPQPSALTAWLGAIAFTFRSTSISPATPTWPSAWAICSDLRFWRTSAIPMSPAASRSSGAAGTSAWAPGSGNMCIFPWAATGRAWHGRS